MPKTKTFAETSNTIPGEATELFNRLALDRIEKGFEHHSAYAIMHQMRWEMETPDHDGDEFKIPNHWGPVLAREFHEMYPEHAGFFRTRRCPASHPDEVREDDVPETGGVLPLGSGPVTAEELSAARFAV